jgi:IS4 transposase
LDHSGYVPSFVSITTARLNEMNIIQEMPMKKGDVIVFDRGYFDFKQFAKYCKEEIYFVSRLKANTSYRILQEHSTEIYENIKFDETIVMTGYKRGKDCPYKLRIIKSYDPETGKTIVLLTNQFEWSAKTIAEVYKDRWQIEIFFKTIKQNLKIKSFFGTSRNAVLTQIWIAMIAFLLLKYLADASAEALTVGALMAVIPVLIFLKKDIWIWLKKPKLMDFPIDLKRGQLELKL